MRALVRVLQAIALLAGVWGIIALVGWLTDAFPPSPTEASSSSDAGAPGDAGPADAGAPDAGAPPEEDAGAPERPPERPTRSALRFTACDPSVERPALAVAQMMGDPLPEVSVGCGPLVQVLATDTDDEAIRPVRVMAFEADPEEPDAVVHAAPAVAADVTGNSSPDLVLGFVHARPEGGARGGSLYLLRADAIGAFDPPEQLASIGVAAAAAADLDGEAGADLVALHLANAFARRPSELWVFHGGPAPAREGRLRTGVEARSLAVADLDRDGHRDLAALAGEPERIDVFFGEGDGRFPRSATLTVAGGAELASGDLTGDGVAEVLVAGSGGLAMLDTGGSDTLEAQPLDAPEGLARPRVVDVDGDGRPDVVGVVDAEIIWLRHRADTDGIRLKAAPLVSFGEGTGFIPVAAEVADLNADGRLDLAMLGRVGDDGPWELVLLPELGRGAVVDLGETAASIPDAPLVLQIAP
ncbi:MAG: FG-GAP repeat domain-containing protein [Myxococcota bacterium]